MTTAPRDRRERRTRLSFDPRPTPEGRRRNFDRLAHAALGRDRGVVVVRPGESLQRALSSLGPNGGVVHLLPGTHDVVASLAVTGTNVTLIGDGIGASRIVQRAQIPVVALFDVKASGFRLRGCTVEAKETNRGMVAFAADTGEHRVEDCEFVWSAPAAPYRGLTSAALHATFLRGCRFRGAWAGETVYIGDASTRVLVADCLVPTAAEVSYRALDTTVLVSAWLDGIVSPR